MKASELRIGNLVWLKSKNDFYEISGGHDIEEIDDAPEFFDAHPIRLTEEWLIKLGFIQGGYEMLFWHHEKLKGLSFAGINWADADVPEYQFLNYEVGTEIHQMHYVHQMQNLFHALTGEELTLKNTTNEGK